MGGQVDAHERWVTYVAKSMSSGLDAIVVEENLRPDETREFMESSFAEGSVFDEGTAVTRILKPMSRFGEEERHEPRRGKAAHPG